MNTPFRPIFYLAATLLPFAQVSGQTVNGIFIGKSVDNVQTDATTVIPNPQSPGPTYGGAYGFQATVEGTGLSAPTVTLAAGSTMPTANSSSHNGGVLGFNVMDSEWAYGSPNFNNWGATSAAEIDTLFATGDYTISVPTFSAVTLTLGTSLANISSVVANAPLFTLTGGTWSGGVYVVNVNQAVTITSNAFAGFSSNANGHISFDLFQQGGGLNINDERLYSDDTGADNFISYTINADTLTSGQTYSVNGSFAAVLDIDTTIPGALLAAFLESSTNFTISAVPEPSAYAACAGLVVLGLACWRRRRKA